MDLYFFPTESSAVALGSSICFRCGGGYWGQYCGLCCLHGFLWPLQNGALVMQAGMRHRE